MLSDQPAGNLPKPDGYAAPEEGVRFLLTSGGGCVDVKQACQLYRKPALSARTLIRLIRKREVIAYGPVHGRYQVPIWQFGTGGGLVPGLPRVLEAIWSQIPGPDQLAPFAFFLVSDQILNGRTPLEALREGDIDRVLRAVAAHAG